MKFIGNISESGTLTIVNRKSFDEFVSQYAGKQVVIDVTKKISKRSDSQNRYYYGCVIPIIQQAFKDLGHKISKEDTHLFLRNRFLQQELITEDGEVIGSRIKSTKELTKSAFGDYLFEITQFAAEILNVQVPNPNEQVNLI